MLGETDLEIFLHQFSEDWKLTKHRGHVRTGVAAHVITLAAASLGGATSAAVPASNCEREIRCIVVSVLAKERHPAGPASR